MDTATLSSPAQSVPLTVAEQERQSEYLLDALKVATAVPGEHRLFRWGKLNGLFPSRVGPSAVAAKIALGSGLLDHVRTEARGKLIVEWVRALPKATAYLQDHDSPKAVLRELQDVIGATRAGVPVWMAQARDEVAQLSLRFEHVTREMMKRLDSLGERVEAALQRVTTTTLTVGLAMSEMVPWATAALTHLDQRASHGSTVVTLSELFQVARSSDVGLSIARFHDGVHKLHDGGLIRLTTASPDETVAEPEYAMEVGGQMMWCVNR